MPEILCDFVYCIKWTGTRLGHLNLPLEPEARLFPGKEKQKITEETLLAPALEVHPQLLEEGVGKREGEKGGHKNQGVKAASGDELEGLQDAFGTNSLSNNAIVCHTYF